MNRKQLCVANVKYKKPTQEDSKRQKGLLRYLTYREGWNEKSKQPGGVDRWHDLGLGRSLAEVTERCEAYKGDHVLAWTLVFNCNPELMRMVAPEERDRFVCELTERALSDFSEARGIEGGIEASYVLHQRLSTNLESPKLPDPHTHVILPGTYYDEGTGERENLFFSRNKQENHIELLHRVTEGVMVDLLDRYIGHDWEQRIDLLEAVREQQRGVVENEPSHGVSISEGGREARVWAGVRCTDEETSAAGIYARFLPNERRVGDGADPKEARVEFRPLKADLTHESAQMVADAFKKYLTHHHTFQQLDALVKQREMRREVKLPHPEVEMPRHDAMEIDLEQSALSEPDFSMDL